MDDFLTVAPLPIQLQLSNECTLHKHVQVHGNTKSAETLTLKHRRLEKQAPFTAESVALSPEGPAARLMREKEPVVEIRLRHPIKSSEVPRLIAGDEGDGGKRRERERGIGRRFDPPSHPGVIHRPDTMLSAFP